MTSTAPPGSVAPGPAPTETRGTHPTEIYGSLDVPHGPAPLRSRLLASVADLGVVALPLVIGWFIVDSLRADNGGGQMDRAVFGGVAIITAAALLVWNRGTREGATGQSVGKGWLGPTWTWTP